MSYVVLCLNNSIQGVFEFEELAKELASDIFKTHKQTVVVQKWCGYQFLGISARYVGENDASCFGTNEGSDCQVQC